MLGSTSFVTERKTKKTQKNKTPQSWPLPRNLEEKELYFEIEQVHIQIKVHDSLREKVASQGFGV